MLHESIQEDFSDLILGSPNAPPSKSGVFVGCAATRKGDKEPAAKRHTCKLTLECSHPFKITDADRRWLELFGFEKAEICGRALRMCQGPDTDMKLVQDVVQGVDCGKEFPLVLYSKSGDPRSFSVRAERETSEAACSLYFYALSQCLSSEEDAPITPTLLIDADEPYSVQDANSAFVEKLGYSSAELSAEGVGVILGPTADGTRWKNALRCAKEGKTVKLVQCVQAASGDVLPVLLQISPSAYGEKKAGSSRSEVIQLAVCCSDPAQENAEGEAAGEVAGMDPPSPRVKVLPQERRTKTGSVSTSVMAHLKAMQRRIRCDHPSTVDAAAPSSAQFNSE